MTTLTKYDMNLLLFSDEILPHAPKVRPVCSVGIEKNGIFCSKIH